MSSEKPFWEGKTCEEMANLHVKVTFVAGAVLTGITDCSGHIRRSRNGSVVPISANRGAERFVPDRDKAKAGWIGYVRGQRRQAMLGELADVLQTVGNLITAFDITDEEVAQAMDDCLERNQERGRL